jgi:hypothetical protein
MEEKAKGKPANRFLTNVKAVDFYNEYMDDVFEGRQKYDKLDKKNPYYLSKAQYGKIIKRFNEEITDLMLYDAFIFVLPFGLGEVSIRKKKVEAYIDSEGVYRNPLPVDYKATKELHKVDSAAKEENKKVYYNNEHSSDFVIKLYYDKTVVTKYQNINSYFVKTPRTLKERMTEVMKNKFHLFDFYELPKNFL